MATLPVDMHVGKWIMNSHMQWRFEVRQSDGVNAKVVNITGVPTFEDLLSLVISEFNINREAVNVKLSFWTPNLEMWMNSNPCDQLCIPPYFMECDNDVAFFFQWRNRRPSTHLFITLHDHAASNNYFDIDNTKVTLREHQTYHAVRTFPDIYRELDNRRQQ